MASGLSIKLDAAGDLDVAGGRLSFVTRGARAKQKLRVRLSTILKEWFLDERVGVPYFEEILVKNPDLDRVREIYRDVVLGTPEVASCETVDVVIGVDRSASIDIACTLDDGTVVELQVNEPIIPSERAP